MMMRIMIEGIRLLLIICDDKILLIGIGGTDGHVQLVELYII